MAVKQDPRMTEPLEGRGPGAHLRAARENKGLSVNAVAESLFLQPKTLELIEADAYDSLPAPTFVRGYLRGYAQVLGLPTGPVLDMYDRQGFEPPPLNTDATESTQAHTSDTSVRLVTYAIAVVLAVLVGLWWNSQEDGGFGIGGDLFGWSSDSGRESPDVAAVESVTAPEDAGADGASVAAASNRTDDPPPDDGSDGQAHVGGADSGDGESAAAALPGVGIGSEPLATATPGPGPIPADGDSAVPSSADGAAPGDAGAAEPSVAAAETAPAGTGAEGGESANPSPLADAAAPGELTRVESEAAVSAAPVDGSADVARAGAPAPASEGPATDLLADGAADAGARQPGLVLEFVHESWVEVYDSGRARLFFNLVQPGTVLNLDGPRPFDVLLGFGTDVRVTLDGRSFDHTPYMKHGVARFEIGSGDVGGTSVAEPGGTSVAESGGANVAESGGANVAESGGTSVAESGGTSVAESGGTNVAESGGTNVAESGGTAGPDTADSPGELAILPARGR